MQKKTFQKITNLNDITPLKDVLSYIFLQLLLQIVGNSNRPAAMACVFIFSAIFHEYVLVLCFNFFYPVLLVMFAGAGCQ